MEVDNGRITVISNNSINSAFGFLMPVRDAADSVI
jgi:hypothetical protein